MKNELSFKQFIFILIMMLSFLAATSCRTVKKAWLEENYLSKDQISLLVNETTQNTTNSSEDTQLLIETEIEKQLKSFKEYYAKAQNENTTATVNITAEEGKEKTATIGSTTVSSNGADITLTTNTTNTATHSKTTEYSKLLEQLTSVETYSQKLTQQLTTEKNLRQDLQREFEAFKTQFEKQQNKKSFTFGTSFFLFLIILIILVIYFYSGKILSFFSKK